MWYFEVTCQKPHRNICYQSCLILEVSFLLFFFTSTGMYSLMSMYTHMYIRYIHIYLFIYREYTWNLLGFVCVCTFRKFAYKSKDHSHTRWLNILLPVEVLQVVIFVQEIHIRMHFVYGSDSFVCRAAGYKSVCTRKILWPVILTQVFFFWSDVGFPPRCCWGFF